VAETSWAATFASASLDAVSHYDDVLVPRMFRPWAELLLDEVALARGEAVADIACGPGTVARVAAARVGPGGRVVAFDFSPAMIAIARGKPPVEGGANIEYGEAPADRLPVDDASFDVVTCQHGLQFFPDRPSAVAEMRRVLRGSGRAAIAVWGEIDSCPPFAAMADAIGDVLGQDLADRYRAGPWAVTGDEVMALLDGAGFSRVTGQRRTLPVVFERGAAHLLPTLLATGIAGDIRALSEDQRSELFTALERRLAPISTGPEVRSKVTAHLSIGSR
jgi:SAM-dependent methyltransferase